MCQLSAVLQRNGKQEKIMESVTSLEVDDHQVTLHTFFEEPRVLRDVVIRRIDFLGGNILLEPAATVSPS